MANVASLEQVLESIIKEEEQEVQQQFSVIDLESAAEASRRISYFNERMNEINAIVENQIATFLAKVEKIKQWGVEAKAEYVEKVEQYSQMLEMFMREEIAKQEEAGKKPKKTISLPYGKIALKKQQPEFQKDDEQLFNYAKMAGLVRVKEETDWATIKKNCSVINGKLVDEDGVSIPGVEVIERPDKFEMKLD